MNDKLKNAEKELENFWSENNLRKLDSFEIQIASALMVKRGFHVSRAYQVIFNCDYEVSAGTFKDKDLYLDIIPRYDMRLDEWRPPLTDGLYKFLDDFVFLEHTLDMSRVSDKDIVCDTSDRNNPELKVVISISYNIMFYCRNYDIPMTDK